jgi:hypothetical protein
MSKMAISAKRIGEVTKADVTGPYGADIPVYALAHTPNLLSGQDVMIMGYKSLTGKLGPFVHILCTGINGISPNGDTGEFVVQSGAKSIMSRLGQIGEDDFPLLAKFTSGRSGPNTWYDME